MIIGKCSHGQKRIMDCRECKKIYTARHAKNKPLYLWSSAKQRARRKGLPFTISVSDVVIPDTCPVLGIPIDWRSRDYAASIDEIVAGGGYVPGNFCVVSGRTNRIKSDASLSELQAIVLYVKIRGDERYGKWPD